MKSSLTLLMHLRTTQSLTLNRKGSLLGTCPCIQRLAIHHEKQFDFVNAFKNDAKSYIKPKGKFTGYMSLYSKACHPPRGTAKSAKNSSVQAD